MTKKPKNVNKFKKQKCICYKSIALIDKCAVLLAVVTCTDFVTNDLTSRSTEH